MPVISTTKMTADQFLMLGEDPPGVRLELVNGEVAVSPSPTPDHGNVVIQLVLLIGNHNEKCNLGHLFSDIDTRLDRFNVRRPDLLFFFAHRTNLIGKKAMEGAPDLAVEVISPSSVEIDREDKFAQYRDAGVAYYWIVDPEQQTLEAYRLHEGQYVATAKGSGSDVLKLPPFDDLEIPLSRLWWNR